MFVFIDQDLLVFLFMQKDGGDKMPGEEFKEVHALAFGNTQKMLKIEEEHYFYDLNSFIADVGGYFGLLFGLSVFDLYDLISDLFEQMRNVFG